MELCTVASMSPQHLSESPLRFLLTLKKDFIYLFLKRGREGEREGKHPCVVASHTPPTGDLAGNPGLCSRLGIERSTLWFTGWHSIR